MAFGFLENALAMGSNRMNAEAKLFGDLLVLQSISDGGYDQQFLLGEQIQVLAIHAFLQLGVLLSVDQNLERNHLGQPEETDVIQSYHKHARPTQGFELIDRGLRHYRHVAAIFFSQTV